MKTIPDSNTPNTFPDQRGRNWEMFQVTDSGGTPEKVCVRLIGHERPNSAAQFFFLSADKACDFVNLIREAH